MKIGIFVSAQIRESTKKIVTNLSLLRDAFSDADLVLGIWTYEKERAIEFKSFTDKIIFIDEPHIHYEPYKDNPHALSNWNYQKKLKVPNERHNHQTKQILAHNQLMKLFAADYDVIVRSRWDTTISPKINYMSFVKETYETPCALAISTRRDYHRSIMTIGEISSWKYPFLNHKDETTGIVVTGSTCEMLLDNGILMHRRDDWNTSLVQQLHDDKRLLAAEFGWYQVLVEHTSHKQWIHYDGGASITRSLIREDREIIKKYESICDHNY